jgi:hypothetical protein
MPSNFRLVRYTLALSVALSSPSLAEVSEDEKDAYRFEALRSQTVAASMPSAGIGFEKDLEIEKDLLVNGRLLADGLFIHSGGGSSYRNTAMGTGALLYNDPQPFQEGWGNTAVGFQALTENTTGFQITAIGARAGFLVHYNGGHVAVGYDALYSNWDGVGNVAIGWKALKNNNGSKNVAVGLGASRWSTGS